MPAEPKLDLEALLRTLSAHGVEFIVVGGVCALLHGAPVATFDLDVVHSQAPANVKRLLMALEEMGAYYRSQPARKLRPQETHLAGPGHQLLLTCFGPLDVLGMIGTGRRYEDLLPHTSRLELDQGLTIQLLDLETLIEIKEETATEKDRPVLTLLRRLLEERRKNEPT